MAKSFPFSSIKEARESVGYTQETMAELLGISRNYLALMETGKRKTPEDLVEAANAIAKKSAEDISAAMWKDRALAAESKLEALKKALSEILKEY